MKLTDKKSKLIKSNEGFSILEILIGLALIAGIGSLVVTSVFDNKLEGDRETARIQMSALEQALKNYKRHCNRFPTEEQGGLQALVTKPSSWPNGKECKRYRPSGYLPELPEDPWGSEYFYESDGRTFNIASFGQDNTEGGEGADADVWLKEKQEGEN